jgi:two-component system OmpR family response regulator/two-component system response regulator QseB
MRILLVEDDRLLGEGIRAGLGQAGYAVAWARDGEEAQQALALEAFDVMILDLGLPKVGGLTVLRWLRGRGLSTPVLILTAQDAVEDRVRGLDAGADDYLTKPFALDELRARLRALQRRDRGRSESVMRHGRLVVDGARRAVTLDGAQVELSAKEFVTLEQLLLNEGRVMSRAQLEEKLYGWGEEVESNAVEVFVHHLRRKLYPELIRTVRGVGYLVPPDDASAQGPESK